MDHDKKQSKPAEFGGGQARLGEALAMDSDEEDIVNMDTIHDQNKGQMADDDEEMPQFTYVRRSQRLSTVLRDKSEISAKPDEFKNFNSRGANNQKRTNKANS